MQASLTIDGIYYVVDPGFAKQKVFNPKASPACAAVQRKVSPLASKHALACKRLSQCCRLLYHAALVGLGTACWDPGVASL